MASQALTPIVPKASPVESLVHPQAPTQYIGPSKAEQLATALGTLAPIVDKTLIDRQTTQDQEAADQGARARDLRGQASVNFKDAVVKKAIPLSGNPFFQAAWKERDGAITADQYKSDLMVALSVGQFATSKDTKDTEPLLSQFREQWIKDKGIDLTDPHFAHGFDASLQQTESNVRTHQANEISKRQEAAAYNNVYHDALSIFDDAQLRSLPSTSVAEAINHTLDLGISVGMDPKVLNGIIMDATEAKVLETGTMKPWESLDMIKTGSGYLGRTVQALNRGRQLQDMLASKKTQEDANAWQLEQHNRTRGIQEASSSLFLNLLAGERSGHLPSVLDDNNVEAFRKLGALDFGSAEQMQTMYKNAGKVKALVDDENVVWELYKDGGLVGTLPQARVNTAYAAHQITDETAQKLTNNIISREQRDKADEATDRANKPKDWSNDPAFQLGMDQIRKTLNGDPFAQLSDDAAKKLNRAQSMYAELAQAWLLSNPTAPQYDRLKHASELRDSVLSLIKEPEKKDQGSLATPSVGPSTPLPNLLNAAQATDPNVPTSKLFPNALAWKQALEEFNNAPTLEAVGATAIGKLAKEYNIPTSQLGAFIDAQSAMYTDVPLPPEPPVATGDKGKKK